MYRVGFPGWKIAARFGVLLLVRVDVHYDPEVKSYWADSSDLNGLVVAGETIDELLREARFGIEGLLDFQLKGRAVRAAPMLSFSSEALLAA